MTRFWRGLCAGGATGLLSAFSYPDPGIWPLAIIAYIPLLWWLRVDRPSPRQAFIGGWVAGALIHGIGHKFLAFTMQEMSHMPPWLAWIVVVAYSLAMGAHQALFAAVVAFICREHGRDGRFVAVAVLAIMAVEFAVPWQFRWFLGNALYRVPVLLQVADLGAVYVVSGMCVAVSAALVVVVTADSARKRAQAAFGVVALLAAWIGYGVFAIAAVDAVEAQRTVRVGIVQPNPSLKEKTSSLPGVRTRMQDRAEALTRSLAADDVDMYIWPEGSLPYYFVHREVPPHLPADRKSRAPPMLKKTTIRAQRFARGQGKPLLLGSLRRDDAAWSGRATNSAIVLDGDKPPRFYDKRKLVAFGEYMPGRELMPSLSTAVRGVGDLEWGELPSILPIAGAQVGVNICYEALFSGFMRTHTAAADFLVNLTDDLWFGPVDAPQLHLMVQMPRAIELRRPFIRATATGISAHVDAAGRIVGETAVWKTATHVADVKVAEIDSPFRVVGLWPMRLVTALVVWLLVVAWRRRRTETLPPSH